MHSLKVVTGMMNNIIKSAHTTYAAADLLKDHTQQILTFYDAMTVEIEELKNSVKEKDARIAELEAELECLKKSEKVKRTPKNQNNEAEMESD